MGKEECAELRLKDQGQGERVSPPIGYSDSVTPNKVFETSFNI